MIFTQEFIFECIDCGKLQRSLWHKCKRKRKPKKE